MNWKGGISKDKNHRNELRRNRYAKNPEKYRSKAREYGLTEKGRKVKKVYNLKYLYGISSDDLLILIVQQNNVCALCKQPFTSSKFTHIDHDHKTHQIRGILCHKCNSGLGLFNHDKQKLLQAIDYLEVTKCSS
jgi:hypothetical protein